MEVGATIARSGDVRALDRAPVDPTAVPSLTVSTAAHGATTVAEVLARHHARGLVVLHRGRLAHEWYGAGIDPTRPNASFSITKSFTGTLAARAIGAGRLDRRARVGDLLPELGASGFADATVADVADMTVALTYDEDYDDTVPGDADGRPAHGFGDYLVATGFEPPATPAAPTSIRSLLAALGQGPDPHGTTFAYATPVTDVLGWLLEVVDGRPWLDQLRDDLWVHVGAEHDAVVLLDPTGRPLAGGGLLVTTRDLARFGQLVCDHATSSAGDVIDRDALDTIRAGGDADVFARGHYTYLGDYTYRDQWWLPGGPSRPLSAWGIYGQVLWIDVEAEVVIACHGGGPLPSDPRRDVEQDAMCRAIVEASSAWR